MKYIFAAPIKEIPPHLQDEPSLIMDAIEMGFLGKFETPADFLDDIVCTVGDDVVTITRIQKVNQTAPNNE